MKKILYVTTTRADYWIMRNLLLDLNKKVSIEIIISGMHINKKYGYTARNVLEDFPNSSILKVRNNKNNNKIDVINTMTEVQKKFTIFSKKNKYDYLMLLGDRSEILPFAIVAGMLNIPIIHLHGGEVTYGAYDDFIRHCVTKISSLHLTSTESHKKRVELMGENNVHNIGSLGCLNFFNESKKIKFFKKNYFVVLFHPETIKDDVNDIDELLKAIDSFKENEKFIFIGCNNDVKGDYYNNLYKKYCYDNNFEFIPSFKNQEYIKLLGESKGLIGNSSSGLIEAPCLNIPIVNIGDRQKGREKSDKIIDCECFEKDIVSSIKKIIKMNGVCCHENPYFNKKALSSAEKIIMEFIK